MVDDRGYNDYALFGRGTAQGVYFVTRIKENALYEVVGEKPVLQRRIEAYDPETKKNLVFLTNQLELGATPISAIYKDRCQMEILFKALKQNLKIKTFVRTSASVAKIQIWIALIAMMILRFLQIRCQFHWSLSNLVGLLRMNFFTHRDLWPCLNKPFDALPVPYE